jgi:DeoR/GlpR family transcriptional regulator of sugar metabolism
MKKDISSKVAGRRQEIANLVNAQGYASIDFLSNKYGVSTQTIRRDIMALSEDSLVTRLHGGAGSVSSLVNISYDARRISMLEEKELIAASAATLIRSSQSIFMTGGSTMEIVAKELLKIPTLCIITNNIHAAIHLYSKKDIELLMPCGRVRHHNGCIIGPATMEFIANFQTDFLIMGIGAISADGLLLDYDYEEAMLMAKMMDNAREVILVTDSTKFDKNATAQVGHLRDISYLVTDRRPPAQACELIDEHNVSLIVPEHR